VAHPEGVPRYELPLWRDRHGWIAGITARGVSGGPGPGGFNLGLGTDEGVRVVTDRWRTVREANASAFTGIVVGRQVHGTEVRHHESRFRGLLVLDQADGHLTPLPGILLAVTVADCIPVYLGVPRTGAIALLHAGWRGTAAGILERGVVRLCEVAGVSPSEVVMHLGVGICGECYEVGPEVLARLGRNASGGPAALDLRAVLAERALASGVGHLTVSSWCTSHHVDRFFSHRADGENAGRMAAYLGRPLP
jgi:YfiH family protein